MDIMHAILGTLLVVTLLFAAWCARDRTRMVRRAATAEQDAAALRAKLDAQQQAHETSTEQLEARLQERDAALRDAFSAAANDAIKTNSKDFLATANEKLAGTIKPINEALQRADTKLSDIEKDRLRTFAELKQQVVDSATATTKLKDETARLVTALRKPHVRGRYGETQLRRVVELAGMKPYCDFNEQDATRDDQGRLLRPDLIVNLPNDRVVAIDAKSNLEPYLDAIEAPTAEDAQPHLERFARAVLNQAEALARKRYWAQYDGSPELVVMFVPGEQFIDAALEHEPKLLDISAQQHVLLAGPTTLIGLLRAIAVGWREKNITEHAQHVLTLGKSLHERSATVLEYVDDIAKHLSRTGNAYNKLTASIDTRLLPALRQLEDADAASHKSLEAPGQVNVVLNELKSLPAKQADDAGA